MITGATSGFGKATAIRFAGNGFNVIITGRRKERLDKLEKELLSFGGIEVLSLNFDVRDQDEVKSVLSNLPEKWKAVDILVNNAGLAVGLDHIDKGDLSSSCEPCCKADGSLFHYTELDMPLWKSLFERAHSRS